MAVSSQANPGDPTQSNTNLALNSSNYSYQNTSSQSLDKTLATVGQGSIKVGGKVVEPEGLNRDIANLTKDIYNVDRQQGNIELTVDHRLLSEEGRKQIAADFEKIADKVVEVVDTLNKASPELAGNVADAADNLQQGASDSVEGKDTTGQQIAEKVEDINQREAESLLAQELILPELGEPGDAPELIGKSFDEQVSELTALKSLQEGNFAAGEQSAEEAFQNGYIKGWESASGNGGNGWIGSDADYESAIAFYQNQNAQLRLSLGLPADAPIGGIGDAFLWGGASLLDATYQTLQFVGNVYSYPMGWSDSDNPFTANYDSLIGTDKLFGNPATVAGALGRDVGEIGSYIWEPTALLGTASILGKAAKFDDVGNVVPDKASIGFNGNPALDVVITQYNNNDIHHLFGRGGDTPTKLLDKFGSPEAALKELQMAAQQIANKNYQTGSWVTVKVGDTPVTIQGRVIDGTFRISSIAKKEF
ncbi:hypothetical protein QE250_15740 [Chromatiaceae bacterium AAb-1]|nr:hypothetical protein [Chromatiaceae bacterium AAb-1]